jgi:uncharacterized iron-regulated membrane protein
MTVRRDKGRFARDTDLHKVIGMIALPLLLVWGFTGAGFELGVVEDAWYALTPGSRVESAEAVSADGDGPDIGVDAAAAAALAVVPGATLAAVDLAVPDEPSAAYTVWVADGVDAYAHGDYPGDVAVAVDRHAAATTITYGTAEEPVAQTIWDSWNYPVHAGIVVNGWWRIVWFVLGLAPQALAVTGVSTWLVRRKARRERLARAQGPARPGLFLAYLAVAVALLPLCGAMTTAERASTSSDVRLAVTAGVGVVVQWRLVATWRSGGV